ncbi:hypothetical protein PF008_g18063 [Phytophthora fragariae]|uniref:CCHC-type domain-containing protein n=1 Tax=Phytophthora fragariae TaxID=53985 RepID=A0A6G0R6F7_9STRA|nr:hypothetical protein PF008_g18063 [Phytophthora fragariae]
MEPRTTEWEASDMKALGILVQLLSPNYQAMVREAKSAREAWETLRTFFVQKNLHNRVQLRKQLHSFEMASGENLMDHLMRFEDLCVRLSAVGETITESEKLVILLRSLPPEYDGMIKIIEAHGSVTLLEAKEMLRREFETIKKRDRQEGAFRADAQDSRRGRVRSGTGRSGGERAQDARGRRGGSQQQNRQRKDKGFKGRCFECNKVGHKRAECPQERKESGGIGGEFVFSVSSDTRTTCWLLDSGASSHMSFDRGEFCEFRALESAMTVTVASGERLRVAGIGSVCFAIGASQTVKLTDVLFVPELDRKLLSIPSLVAKGAEVLF